MPNKVSNYTHLYMLIFPPYGVFKAKGNKYLREKQNPKILIETKILGTAVRGLRPTEMNPNEKTRDMHMNYPETMRLNMLCF